MVFSEFSQFDWSAVGTVSRERLKKTVNTRAQSRVEYAIFFVAGMVVLGAIGLVIYSILTAKSERQPPTPMPVGQTGAWELVFSDEFDGEELDTTNWVTCYWWDWEGCTNSGNEELQWYLPDNIIVSDGTLKLEAREEVVEATDGKIYEYTSGLISTGNDDDDSPLPPRFAMHYGYLEIRAKVPYGQGLWPAIWMLPTDFTSKPEFDILEIKGHEPNVIYMSVHYLDDEGEYARERTVGEGPDYSTDWHIFALDWQPDQITWYIDGERQWVYPNAEPVSQKPMYLLLNLAVGGEWVGPPDETTPFPSAFEIDYVRVWQQNEKFPTPQGIVG